MSEGAQGHECFLRRCIEPAREANQHGKRPVGSGVLLETRRHQGKSFVAFAFHLIQQIAECIERVFPELLMACDPVLRFLQGLHDQFEAVNLPFDETGNKSRILQDSNVLRGRWLCDGKRFSQFRSCAFPTLRQE